MSKRSDVPYERRRWERRGRKRRELGSKSHGTLSMEFQDRRRSEGTTIMNDRVDVPSVHESPSNIGADLARPL